MTATRPGLPGSARRRALLCAAGAIAWASAVSAVAAGAPPAWHATAHVDSLQQAAAQGARIFDDDTFGTKQVWVPANSFDNRLMTCAACHTDGGRSEGTTPAGQHLPSLIGAAARYPRYKAKKHAVYTLERQIAHCVRDGVRGTVPGWDSPQMTDLVAYLTQLSRGATMGLQFPAAAAH